MICSLLTTTDYYSPPHARHTSTNMVPYSYTTTGIFSDGCGLGVGVGVGVGVGGWTIPQKNNLIFIELSPDPHGQDVKQYALTKHLPVWELLQIC